MVESPFIQIENITKIFGKNIILNNVNLIIPYKEIFGIIGKSGSGKTTLLNVLIGFLKPEKGKVLYQSRDIKIDPKSIKQQFGFTAQQGSFYPKLTVKENLEYFGTMYNLSLLEVQEKIPGLLKLVNLEGKENVVASKLSSGMQKRLDIACGIIHDPKVLILDEPTEDLDPVLRREILNLLKKINKEKEVTIIVTSHLLTEMENFCTKLAILENKTIIEQGSVDELKDRYSKEQEIILETKSAKYSSLIKILKKRKDIKKISERYNKLVIYTKDPESVLKEILSLTKKDKLLDLDINKPSLNEVFENLLKNLKEEKLENVQNN
ncbi:MAG: ABC transporter ATP-binding protein [Nanoarchaeota archaeon]|nr:ABC transporter ATP-binding protein [Nanoarchaeota archaeon]